MYTVQGYSSLDTENGCDVDTHVETLKLAKQIASHWFTDFEQPLERIIIKNPNGEIVVDKY